VIQPEKAFIVAPVTGSYPIKQNVTVCGLTDFHGLIK